LAQEVEADLAGKSLYYHWWRFLKAYLKYLPNKTELDDPTRKDVFSDFGELGDCFKKWWMGHGRNLFSEQGDIPLVEWLPNQYYERSEPTDQRFRGFWNRPVQDRLRNQSDPEWRKEKYSIVLKVPLTIKRELIIEQINLVLDAFHPRDKLLRYEFSTACRRLYPRQRYRPEKLETLLSVWEARKSDAKIAYWKIGENLGLSPADSGKKDKQKGLGAKTERLFKQADKLVHNAALGQFPRDDKKIDPREASDWLKNSR
jgi:hypothetical protein